MMIKIIAWITLVVFAFTLNACQHSPSLEGKENPKSSLTSEYHQAGPRKPELQWSLDLEDWPQGMEKKYYRFKSKTETHETKLFRFIYSQFQPRNFVSCSKGFIYVLSHHGILYCLDVQGSIRWSKGMSRSSIFSGAYTLRTKFDLPSLRNFYFRWRSLGMNLRIPSYFFPLIPNFNFIGRDATYFQYLRKTGNMHMFDDGVLLIQDQSHVIAYDENGNRLWSRKMKGLQHSNQTTSLAFLVEDKRNQSIVTAINSTGIVAWRKSFKRKSTHYSPIAIFNKYSGHGVQQKIDRKISEGSYQHVVYFKDFQSNMDTNYEIKEGVAIFSRSIFSETGEKIYYKEIVKIDDAFYGNYRSYIPGSEKDNEMSYIILLNQIYNNNGILFSESELYWCHQLNKASSPEKVYKKFDWDNQLLWNHTLNYSYKLPFKSFEKEISFYSSSALSTDDIYPIFDGDYLGIFFHQDEHHHESYTMAVLIDAEGQIRWEIALNHDVSYVFVETDEAENIYLGVSDHINQTSKALAVNATNGQILWEKNLTQNGEITSFYLTQSGLLLYSTTENPGIIYALGD